MYMCVCVLHVQMLAHMNVYSVLCVVYCVCVCMCLCVCVGGGGGGRVRASRSPWWGPGQIPSRCICVGGWFVYVCVHALTY